MSSLFLYFHAHQPIRLREFSLLDINKGNGYEDEAANLADFNSLLDSRCLPLNRRLCESLQKNRGALRAGISLSGNFLEMLEKHRPDAVDSYRELADTGMMEFLGENYFRSFSFLFSEEEFIKQVKLHRKKIKALFGCTPPTFRNTEAFYSNALASCIERLGFRTLLNESPLIFQGMVRGAIYRPAGTSLNFLQGGEKISNFKFEISAENPDRSSPAKIVPVSVDCSSLDEAGAADVFRFIETSLKKERRFILPGEAGDVEAPFLDVPADDGQWPAPSGEVPWGVNYMQKEALQAVYAMSGKVHRRSAPGLLAAWRKLQMSDHFYNMMTGRAGNEDNPYSSPYEAYIRYMNILADLSKTVSRSYRDG